MNSDQKPMNTTKPPLAERFVFGARAPLLVLFVALTVFFAMQASKVGLDTDLRKMVPLEHEYIQNLFKHKDELGLGNDIRIIVEAKQGDIFNDDYLQQLKAIAAASKKLEGVDQSKILSLWSSEVRWLEVTVDGFRGDVVIPQSYDGSERSLDQLRLNILRSGQVGRLIADDFKSTVVHLHLYDVDADAGERINYTALSDQLEAIRDEYSNDLVQVRIVGFAKKIGDLVAGAKEVAMFFLLAIAISFILLVLYSRCLISAVAAIVCSITAVIWQLGMLHFLGYGIDPYSMLVPFLVFAIGVSHGVQVINCCAVESASNPDKKEAACCAFRALYLPGIVALVSDAIGFLTLWIIDIGVIQELAKAASLGVAAVILTNLVLLPILMSYLGVGERARRRACCDAEKSHTFWAVIAKAASPKVAPISLFVAALLAVGGLVISKDLKIGDLDKGAPELRPDSRYNLDNAYMVDNYSISADVLVVMVETAPQACNQYKTLNLMDDLQWLMTNTPGVQSSVSLVDIAKRVITGYNEGNLKWFELSEDQLVLNQATRKPLGLMSSDCDLAPVIVFLDDHKAETLDTVVKAVEHFAAQHNSKDLKFLLASGNAGIEAATNQTIASHQFSMLILVYAVVTILCLITFRSWRAALCIILPLVLTSILCEALMTLLGIGLKVATLPVIALGVGIGVDYGIYIYARLASLLKNGVPLQEAYFNTLTITGKAVSFTGLTLAIGVGTWIFSDLKFQADMGLLLTFMFLWNMVGALWLLPAMARFLLAAPQEAESKKVDATSR